MSTLSLPSYAWRAPAWTGASRYPLLYDDHSRLLVECAVLEELEPDLECWAAARRGLQAPVDPFVEHEEDRPLGPKEFLAELEHERREVRAVFKRICRVLQARREAGELYEDLVQRTHAFWDEHLERSPELFHRLHDETESTARLALLRERFDARTNLSADAVAAGRTALAEIEALIERRAERAEEGRVDHARDQRDSRELYDRVHDLVRRIHAVRPHPIERSIPRAPPCAPEHAAEDAFVLPVRALRLFRGYVRDLAELDAFLAAGRLPRPEPYLPPPEERFATIVRGRHVLRDILERAAKACQEEDERIAHHRALFELRRLCLQVALHCGLFAELDPAAFRLEDDGVREVAAGLLGSLLASDHPLAPLARARISAAMALTTQDAPPEGTLDLASLHPTAEENEAIQDAKTAVYGELPDSILD